MENDTNRQCNPNCTDWSGQGGRLQGLQKTWSRHERLQLQQHRTPLPRKTGLFCQTFSLAFYQDNYRYHMAVALCWYLSGTKVVSTYVKG